MPLKPVPAEEDCCRKSSLVVFDRTALACDDEDKMEPGRPKSNTSLPSSGLDCSSSSSSFGRPPRGVNYTAKKTHNHIVIDTLDSKSV